MAIKTQLGLRQVKMAIGSQSITTLRAGGSTTSFLRVDAWPDDKKDDLEALLPLIASIVLDRLPDLLGKQLLIVQVHRGFDLGIATWTLSYQEAHDAAAWREKLGRLHAPSTRI